MTRVAIRQESGLPVTVQTVGRADGGVTQTKWPPTNPGRFMDDDPSVLQECLLYVLIPNCLALALPQTARLRANEVGVFAFLDHARDCTTTLCALDNPSED